ncbi:MAG: acetyl-CoA carboxylase carboxyltransferase subunit alpha [Alphaproteobacteria bacterium]|jgi:acetyl-CoA carboxylase carboxyl transferase subunit alpha|nr:acetyl-CoA carboxylase carboxyltransferase subunit alpha [Pelagibacterales bacterium]MDG2268544.1 acetyl-CoA carboxylase carboxyltransferase subunit alpha [Alphaproteobacteria bacterium]
MHFLDFEQPIIELEAKIRDLSLLDTASKEIFSLKRDVNSFLEKTYSKLSPWQIAQVARHPDRPHASNYINALIKDFQTLSGDRSFADDNAIISGIGSFNSQSIMVIGQEKGFDTDSRVKHNFGMAKPEGYRKVSRLMKLADKFNMPLITFVDTAGAYPGVGAEERGQAEAIASCIQDSLEIKVPFISVIIGEGGSGGAIALASANKVLMLQNAIYSVISPEGCASILWRDNNKAELAADSLGITANFLKEKSIIEEVISEPIGGAHRDHILSIKNVEEALKNALNEIKGYTEEQLIKDRQEKFLKYGRLLK